MDERRWTVGELADAAGLTVRTLHHFDEIGLVRPAERSARGHRRYTDPDVRRLFQVLALRELGMPLSEIARSLDDGGLDLEEPVRRQLAELDRRLAAEQRLRLQLVAVLEAMQQAQRPTIDQLVQTMEAMMQAKYFTPDQLSRLKARHGEAGPDGFDGWRRRWAELDAEARRLLETGTDPADPAAQGLAARWTDLMDDMTGGDRRLLTAMYAKLDGQGAETATLGVVSTPVWDYLKRAFAVGFGRAS